MAEEDKGKPGTEGAAGAGGGAAGADGKGTGTTADPKPAGAPGGAASGEKPPEARLDHVELADDDEIPENVQKLALSPKALKGRLERRERSVLKKWFGTDDPKVVETRMAKIKELEEDAEKRRLEAMSEQERLKEQIAKRDKENADLKDQVAQGERARTVDREERRLTKAASAHIDEDMVDDALSRLERHVKGLSDKELRVFDADKWFAKLAEDKPKFAKTKPGDKDEKKPAEKKKLEAGARADEQPSAPKPGESADKPNFGLKSGKSKSEANAELAKRGLSVRL